MNRTISNIYCVMVIVVLLGVAAYLGWNDYTLWKNTSADFRKRTTLYASELNEILLSSRNIREEINFAEKLLKQDEQLVALQAMSDNFELRFSTVQPIVDNYANKPLGLDMDLNDLPGKWRYTVFEYPLESMPGLKVFFLGTMLTISEIRQSIIILLATAGSFFILTCLLIIFSPGKTNDNDSTDKSIQDEPSPNLEQQQYTTASEHVPDMPEVSSDEISFMESGEDRFKDSEDDLVFESEQDRFKDSEDELIIESEKESTPSSYKNLLESLNHELENADYTGLDLSLALLQFNRDGDSAMRKFWQTEEFYLLNDNKYGIIEIGQSWRGMMNLIKNFINNLEEQYIVKAGITSKNTRIIRGEDLIFEAESALAKTSHIKNIAGFHANPEKYREYKESNETEF